MKSVFILVTALALLVVGSEVSTYQQAVAFPVPSPLLVDPAQHIEAQVRRSIELSAPKISTARQAMYIDLVTQVALRRFATQERRDWWIALLGVESGFDSSRRSPTGATGLGQLIPSYRNDFGAACGITGVDVRDLTDDYVNLNLSACYFNKLIDDNGGNIPLALVSYNQGQFSQSYRNAKRGGAPNQEAAAYVTRVAIKKARVSR